MPYDPTLELSSYKFPPLNLLSDYGGESINVRKEELEANKDKIVETLKNYDIKIQRIKATIGPAVTLYEIVPEAGVRISRIKNLEDDIALSLAAMGIRIIAPIPGKGTIGIEVPNQNPEIVSIKSLLASEKFKTQHLRTALRPWQNHLKRDIHRRPCQNAASADGRCNRTGKIGRAEYHHHIPAV